MPQYAIDLDEGRESSALGAPIHRLTHPLTTGSDHVGVSIDLMHSGSRIKRHRRPYEEAYNVTQGSGLMFLESLGDIDLYPGSSVYIHANTTWTGQHSRQRGPAHNLLAFTSPFEAELPVRGAKKASSSTSPR